MNWDKLELHVENMIPGLVLGGLIASFIRLPEPLNKLTIIGEGAVFVAASYLLGTLGNVLARALVDTVSKHTFRPLFIKVLARDKLSPEERSWRKLGERYSRALDAGLTCGKILIETEVAKRRLTGRLVRSCLLPAWTALWIVGDSWTLPRLAIASISLYVMILMLYAYAEVVVFREGLRGERVRAAA
jgi:hypothetical protein